MKKGFLFIFLLLPVSIAAQNIIETTSETVVMGGEYRVSNNVWGATTAQKLAVDLNVTYFKVILSEHNSSSVAAYPFIWKGSHWGNATTKNNPMPMVVSEITSAPFTWVIDTAGVNGTWNCAFEAWFDDTPTGTNYSGELMIWINYHGGAGPGGSVVDTVEIGGYTWHVFFAPWTQNYIAYRMASGVDSVSLDLKDFIHDALTRGYLCTPWYLVSMEAGFEIWRDGQGLTTYSYSASVVGGGSEENYAPAPFLLLTPSNNKNLTVWTNTFKWQKTVDANLDPIEYIFHLYNQDNDQDIDTTISGIVDDTLVFNGSNCLQPYTYYTWYVEATDGIDTIESTTRRKFRTPRVSGVDLVDQIPNRFILGQNYPNPFNPLTTISYSLPHMSNVTLKIYDVMGREMATLVNNERKAVGDHEVSFNATDLPSGVYFYRMSAIPLIWQDINPTTVQSGQIERYVETKRMILIK
jgi:cellulose 1,4-beta-cellobiosidase